MKNSFKKRSIGLAGLAALVTLAGCPGSDGNDSSNAETPGDSPKSNTAPAISGTPSGFVKIGESWSFIPVASDPDGDSMSFSAQNIPSWASFDNSTGAMSGTPDQRDVGMYAEIRISVSDGSLSDSLPQFSVNVTQIAMGSATLNWTAPTQNTDGSPLVDLTAYKIYYGVSEGNYSNQIQIDNSGITTYVVESLTPDTYYFVATAVNSDGLESQFSNVASMTVN